MPTAKPRLQITLTRPQHELLTNLARLQERSASSIVTELLDQVLPVLERVAVVLQAATRAQESAKEGLKGSLESAERDMRPHVAAALGQLDLLAMELGQGPSTPPDAAAERRRRRGADPRLVTRGSGTEKRTRQHPAKAIRRGSKSSSRRAKR